MISGLGGEKPYTGRPGKGLLPCGLWQLSPGPWQLHENLGLLTAATHSFCQLQVLVDQQEGSGDWLSIRDRIGMLILLQTVTFSILILCHVDI